MGTRPEGCEQSGLEKAGCRAGQGGSQESRDDGRAGLGDAQPERKKLLKGWGWGWGFWGEKRRGPYQGMQLSAALRRKGERKGLGCGGLVPPPAATAMVCSSITQPYSLLSVKKAGTRRDWGGGRASDTQRGSGPPGPPQQRG